MGDRLKLSQNLKYSVSFPVITPTPESLQKQPFEISHELSYSMFELSQSHCDVGTQYLLTWDGGSQGKLALDPLTRRGGYLATVEQAEIIDKKQEEAMNKMMDLAIGQVQFSKGKGTADVSTSSPAASSGKIPANTGATAPGSDAVEGKVFIPKTFFSSTARIIFFLPHFIVIIIQSLV